jgi:glyoxylase-like metal-dependent hydrolase (beta-lactamase superfamily II)
MRGMHDAFAQARLRVFERGWLSSNCVLFDAGAAHPTVLVDTGYWTHAVQTAGLVRHALGQRSLDRIVNTHLHSDHCGGNAELVAQFRCLIDVPAAEARKVDDWDEDALSFKATGQQCPRFSRNGQLAGGSTLMLAGRPWQLLSSPGHDPHSLALYQPELQILISADALWENGFGVVFPEIDGIDAFDAVRSTLELFASLPVRWVIPGHGAPFGDAPAAIQRALSRLGRFEAEPARHAQHAAKVLLKFHLLEVRSVERADLLAWMASTPLLRSLHRGHGGRAGWVDWCDALVADLVRSGALHLAGDIVRDDIPN